MTSPPYRYKRQRYTTVMARVPTMFLHPTLWPEFRELSRTLQQILLEVPNDRESCDLESGEYVACPPAGLHEERRTRVKLLVGFW